MNNDWIDDYLMHHGILGQKWGIRRYQNADGTLTDAGRRRQERNDKWRSTKIDEVNRIYGKQDARAEKRYNKKMEKLARNPKNETKMEKATIKYNTQKAIRDELREIETTKLSTMTPEEYYGKATARTIAAVALTSFIPNGAAFSVAVGLLDRPSEANIIEQRKVGSKHGKEGSAKLAAVNARVKEEKASAAEDRKKVAREREEDRQMAKQMAPEKKKSIDYARKTGHYENEFLEAIPNKDWYGDQNRMLKEYERFYDAGGYRGYTRDLEERRKKGKL